MRRAFWPLSGMLLLVTTVDSSAQRARAASREVLVPVATRRLPRGTVLTESDITVARVVVREAPAERAAPGWVTRRVVLAGEVLQPPTVTPPPLIAAGQSVQVVVATDGVDLTVSGTALASATLGDPLPVRLDGHRRVRTVVTGPGRVLATPSRATP